MTRIYRIHVDCLECGAVNTLSTADDPPKEVDVNCDRCGERTPHDTGF